MREEVVCPKNGCVFLLLTVSDNYEHMNVRIWKGPTFVFGKLSVIKLRPFASCVSLARIAASACDSSWLISHQVSEILLLMDKTAKQKMPQLLHKRLLACDDQQIGI